MREIKFRAWDKKNKAMIYPIGILFDGRVVNFCRGMIEPYEGYELMQYTGLKDKNGVEMYEGDIVIGMDMLSETIPPFKGVIGFKDGSFVVEDGVTTYYRWMDYLLEVIGNIYENPDLMDI